MSRRKKARHEVEAETRKYTVLIATLGKIINRAIPWTGLCVIFFFVYKSIQSLAGQQTVADIAIKWFATIKMNQWVAWTISGLCGTGWYRERRLRRKKISALSKQKKDVEVILDKNRTSSGLSPGGLEMEGAHE